MLELYRSTPITMDNYTDMADLLKSCNSLIDMMEKLQKKVLNEKTEKSFGGGESKLFEDGATN